MRSTIARVCGCAREVGHRVVFLLIRWGQMPSPHSLSLCPSTLFSSCNNGELWSESPSVRSPWLHPGPEPGILIWVCKVDYFARQQYIRYESPHNNGSNKTALLFVTNNPSHNLLCSDVNDRITFYQYDHDFGNNK